MSNRGIVKFMRKGSEFKIVLKNRMHVLKQKYKIQKDKCYTQGEEFR